MEKPEFKEIAEKYNIVIKQEDFTGMTDRWAVRIAEVLLSLGVEHTKEEVTEALLLGRKRDKQ